MISLDLEKTKTHGEGTCPGNAEETARTGPADAETAFGNDDAGKILRFYRSERLLHWAIAIPFLVCYVTALVMVVYYNPDPLRPYRAFFSWAHRISGICLAVLPLLAIHKGRRDVRLHFYNIKQAWTWVLDDFKWLALLLLSSVSSRIKLPEQGKFNAAEKINFMVLMGTYPLYIATGVLIWATRGAFLAWVVHFLMAVVATPLILGHMYMAMISRSGRPGLQGMISGFVDRQWAKHHYRHWYREHYESNEEWLLREKEEEPDPPIVDLQP